MVPRQIALTSRPDDPRGRETKREEEADMEEAIEAEADEDLTLPDEVAETRRRFLTRQWPNPDPFQ